MHKALFDHNKELQDRLIQNSESIVNNHHVYITESDDSQFPKSARTYYSIYHELNQNQIYLLTIANSVFTATSEEFNRIRERERRSHEWNHFRLIKHLNMVNRVYVEILLNQINKEDIINSYRSIGYECNAGYISELMKEDLELPMNHRCQVIRISTDSLKVDNIKIEPYRAYSYIKNIFSQSHKSKVSSPEYYAKCITGKPSKHIQKLLQAQVAEAEAKARAEAKAKAEEEAEQRKRAEAWARRREAISNLPNLIYNSPNIIKEIIAIFNPNDKFDREQYKPNPSPHQSKANPYKETKSVNTKKYYSKDENWVKRDEQDAASYWQHEDTDWWDEGACDPKPE